MQTRLAILASLFLWTAASALALDKIMAVDADDHPVVLNAPDRISVIISSGEDTQDQTREASRALDSFQGRSDFRIMVVTDLRDSLAGLVPSYVKRRMRESLDKEALRLAPIYKANGSSRNARADLCAIADYTGTICLPLGQPKPRDTLWIVIFGPDGRVYKRWNDMRDFQKLHAVVGKMLESPPKN